MDIQFVLDAYACIGYIVDYINKSGRGLSRLLRLCIEDCRRGNKSIQEQMKACSHILYNSTEVCAQEAAWCRCRLPMCSTTVTVEFINSSPPATRQRVLKSNAEILKLLIESIDVYKKGIIDRYAVRSDDLEGYCLAEFVANFTYCNKAGRSLEEPEDDAPALEEIDEGQPEEAEEPQDELDADADEAAGTSTQKTRRKLKTYPLKDKSGIMKERKKSKVIR